MTKRLFPGSKADGHNKCAFPATKRIIGDLNWLMQRFPLDIKNKEEYLKDLTEAQKHFEVQEEMLNKPKKVLPSPKFMGKLLEFQKEGLAFLLHNPRSLLADEMGLGKTICALSWLTKLNESPPYVIVVPPHILRQWKSEIAKFLGEDISVHVIKGLKPYSLPASEIYLIHYLILRGWKNYLPRFGFNACIFDEIQELRRHESDKYSAASLLAESTDNVIGLSGTPFYNLGAELWNVFNILEHHCLGDYGSFTREWCTGYLNQRIADPKVFGDYLKSEGLMLRRMKEDVLNELPPKRRIVQNIDVDEGKFDELIAPTVELAKKIPSIKDAWERGRESMQAIDSTRMITGIAKAHYVTAFVKTLMEAGEKVLLYAHHHAVMDIYMEDLKEYLPVMISGRQDAKIKDEAQKAFMAGDTDIIIVSLRSGTGLNLQRARCVVFGELDWSPAIHDQCESRVHRIGVKDSVLCYYLTCNAGTDQHMMETLGLKTSQFINIMGDREETEEDKMMAQTDMQEHMKKVIELLQQGGRKKEISDEKIIEKLKKLERLPTSKEPTSISEFYDEISEQNEIKNDIDEETKRKLNKISQMSVSKIVKGIDLDDFEGE
ncbi:MAG: DEAD/DEAH box helicase [Thermoplasmata archaeon]|nr:DEAD/DEAH box helicase [Thermoplasmata archaeon]